jgi:hypothetical protein
MEAARDNAREEARAVYGDIVDPERKELARPYYEGM